MKKETPKTSAAAPSKESKERKPSLPTPPKGLDFNKLDLSIDRVDERLSPGENNIFDK